MKRRHPLALSAAVAVLPMLAAPSAQAQQRAVSGPRITLPSHSNHFSWERGHGFHRGFGGVVIVERALRQAQDEREIVQEAPPPPAAVPLPEQAQGGAEARKPYVAGGTYASLPGGCMKMIEDGASYYFCGGGEWYRQTGDGSGAKYRGVARP